MTPSDFIRYTLICFVLLAYAGAGPFWRSVRRRRYTRGRRLGQRPGKRESADGAGLLWGNSRLPLSSATQHFLVAGTTGSGKTLLQRRLMDEVLSEIRQGTDSRALIFDAKHDVVSFLHKVGVGCPVYSLNPFEARDEMPIAVSWDIAMDITSLARAQNLVTALIPAEGGGNNQYFTDAARQVVTGVAESLLRHSPEAWTFPDFVYATLNMERLKLVLGRDAEGREILDGFFGDERTAYQVFTTIASKMAYYRPVAALWQRATRKLSLKQWLRDESIVLLGANATVKTALSAINDIIFRTVVEEIDVQTDSAKRRTWIWIDEARLSGPLLRSEMIPYLAVKGRSRGACLVLSFQDIEGFREAAGVRVANEIVAQCSHKALLRLESEESATWASRLLGQFETIEVFRGESGEFGRRSRSLSEQRVQKEAVLPSEFYEIPVTSKQSGLSGYFVSPEFGAVRGTVPPGELQPVVVSESEEVQFSFTPRPDSAQVFRPWTDDDKRRLGLLEKTATGAKTKRLRLKPRREQGLTVAK